jgi:hypothetical protein
MFLLLNQLSLKTFNAQHTLDKTIVELEPSKVVEEDIPNATQWNKCKK